MVGSTEPKASPPGTIRGDYAHMSFSYADEEGIGIPNLIHASGDTNDAELEIAHWFSGNEIFNYKTASEKFTQLKGRSDLTKMSSYVILYINVQDK